MNGSILFASPDMLENLQSHPRYREARYYDTSSRGEHGQYFSPFTLHEDTIPVPGQPAEASHSVEGIWQGLKIIDGETDFSLFGPQRPRKRRYSPYEGTRFLLGDDEVDLITARHQIYVPSYTFMFENIAPAGVIADIVNTSLKGIDQIFYDVDGNSNINDPSKSYSHSALLVDLLKRYRDS